MELLNDEAKRGLDTREHGALGLIKRIKKGIKIVLSGWQGTNFPVAYTEQDKVKNEYMVLIHGKDNLPKNKQFIQRYKT